MAAARKCDICGKFYEPYNNVREPAIPLSGITKNSIAVLNV